MNSPARLSHSPDTDPNQSMFSKVPESVSFHGLASSTQRKMATGPQQSLRLLAEEEEEHRSKTRLSDPASDVQDRIRASHHALNDLVENLDQKVSEILEFHEVDFLRAFKHQMNLIVTELDMLRKMMDAEVLRLAHDRKLRRLEKQVDYFRSQALRLKNDREEYVSKIKLLKERLECAEQEKKFFEAFVIEASKENQDLKLRLKKGEEETMKKIQQYAEQEAIKRSTEPKSVNVEQKQYTFSKLRVEEALGLEQGPGNKFFPTEPAAGNDSVSKSKHSSNPGLKSEYLNPGMPGASSSYLLAVPQAKPSKEASGPSLSNTELQYWKAKFLTESKSAKNLKRELLDKAINKQEIIAVMKNCILEVDYQFMQVKRSVQLQKLKQAGLSSPSIVELSQIEEAIKWKEFNESDKLQVVRAFLSHDFILDSLFEFVEQAPRQKITPQTASQVLEKVCGPTSCKSTSAISTIHRQSNIRSNF